MKSLRQPTRGRYIRRILSAFTTIRLDWPIGFFCVFICFCSDFLGRLQPSKTTTQKTPRTQERRAQCSLLSALIIKCSHHWVCSLLSAPSLKPEKYAISLSPINSLWGVEKVRENYYFYYLLRIFTAFYYIFIVVYYFSTTFRYFSATCLLLFWES